MTKRQKDAFLSGNQMAAQAAADINYNVMGYFPISPSTEVAQYLDMMGVNGKHDVKLIAADGEHGAAGICYGAATTGARVFNATSANGLMYMLEQLPVQSGTRYPMVMNLINRTVSGPLNIHCDHSDMYFALNSGWIMLGASNPQSVYDLNIIALKLAEHRDVRLPAMVNYDGYITSHQKHNVKVFEDHDDVRNFVGEKNLTDFSFIGQETPITVGAHMKGDDFINNRYQLEEAHKNALQIFDDVALEYEAISGRKYEAVEKYQTEDADVIMFIVNSSMDIAKAAVDQMRANGQKVGLVRPNLIRPFPQEAFFEAVKDAKALVIAERAESPGANGANLAHDIKSVLHDKKLQIPTATRVYGLGGKEFFSHDAVELLQLGYVLIENESTVEKYGFYGVNPGDMKKTEFISRLTEPLPKDAYKSGLITTTYNEETHQVEVKMPALRNLTAKPKRLVGGHGACPGCGIFPGLELFFKGIEGDIIIVNQTGCAYVVTAGYPYSAYNQHYIHNLFQSGPATLSGVAEAIFSMKDRGEIEFDDDATFVMVSGDGGMDIGMGSAIGTALRGHHLIMLEYDNQGYMNTGAQMSYSTPIGNRTATTNIGKLRVGKQYQHKDTAMIMAGTHMPYIFTGTEAFPEDLVKKGAKAHWYAKNVGPVYGKILIACPLNWKSADHDGTNVVKAATDACFFPIFEIEQGITKINYNPEEKNKRIPLNDWLKFMGKTTHLLKPENEHILNDMEHEINRRWERLKAMDESPVL